MTMASARFVEYSVLFLAIALALRVRYTLSAQDVVPRLSALNRRLRWIIAIAEIGAL